MTRTDDGVWVINARETMEQVEQFSREQVGPQAQTAGVPGPPHTSVHEVHNDVVEASPAVCDTGRVAQESRARRRGSV